MSSRARRPISIAGPETAQGPRRVSIAFKILLGQWQSLGVIQRDQKIFQASVK